MDNHLISIFTTTLIAIIIGYCTSRLANAKKISDLLTICLMIVISLLASLGVYGYKVFTHPAWELRGIWLEEYSTMGVRTYGLAKFQVDISSGEIKFCGDAYDANGNHIGQWNSFGETFSDGDFYYFYIAHSDIEKPNDPRYGMGKLNFENIPEFIKTGKGFFAAVSQDSISKREVEVIKRIVDEEDLKLIEESPSEFVKKEHKKKTDANGMHQRK